MLVAAGGRLPPGPVKWSRMRGQRGACGALVIPDDRWEPCHLSREGGGGPLQGTDTAAAVARPSREEVLAGSFQGCSHSWPICLAPPPPFYSIPSLLWLP